jgi:hypothetical protein
VATEPAPLTIARWHMVPEEQRTVVASRIDGPPVIA